MTNEEWELLRPLLPVGGVRGGRWSDHRAVINGVFYRARTGVPWRDLPERFGHWVTVYKRHRRWSEDGTWQRLLAAVQAGQDAQGRIDWAVAVDSTIVRAHQHSAGAPRQKGDRTGTKRPEKVRAGLADRLRELLREKI